MKKNVLTIAGLDPSGCAGISADLKTFQAFGVHGLAVVTAITAQNTQSVDGVFGVQLEIIRAQLKSILSDIEVHAVKIGLLPDSNTLHAVADLCGEFELTNIVVDPVLRSTTGYLFADESMVHAYKRFLFPIATVITPNLEEASTLSGKRIEDVSSMKEVAAILYKTGPKNIVITGGHFRDEAIDVLYDGTEYLEFKAKRIETDNDRGTGCSFSSILALHLAREEKVSTAIAAAKEYISRGLVESYKIGKGKGLLRHL